MSDSATKLLDLMFGLDPHTGESLDSEHDAEGVAHIEPLDVLRQMTLTLGRLNDAFKQFRNGGAMVLGENHVVVCDGVYFQFDLTENEAGVVIDLNSARPCVSLDATRFTESEALVIASKMKNGEGKPGEAEYIVDALFHDISNRETVMMGLTSIPVL